MGSLTEHLVEPGDHGRLKFHPSCPVCRQERLFGSLSSEPVVSRRAQALLAGGVLAVSGAAPGVAVALEPDMQVEGVAAPDQPSGVELDDPGFDPGGDTALPFDTGPAPGAPVDAEDTGDGAPLDAEPDIDLDARLANEEVLVTDEDAAAPPAEAVAPVDAVPPSDPAASDPSPEAVPRVPTTHDETAGADPADEQSARTTPRSDRDPSQRKERSEVERFDATTPSPPDATGDPSPTPPEPYAVPVSPAPATDSVAVAPASAPVPAPPKSSLADARGYLVEPGDSLWSIAKRLLGRDASPARIAREVNRLWSLNEARIATGDPDLLMVGTRLRLR
jgi:LysM domain